MNIIMSAHAVGALGAVVAILVLLQYAEAQKQHVVGDNQGWTVPYSNKLLYRTWASGQKFSVGDTLLFNFATSQHNVVEVRKESYDSCTANNSIKTNNNGPASITLDKDGEHYYICGFGTHCSSGQKLAVNVSEAADSPNNPANPPPTDTTPSPPPSSAPVTVTTSAFASFLLLLFSTFMVVMF